MAHAPVRRRGPLCLTFAALPSPLRPPLRLGNLTQSCRFRTVCSSGPTRSKTPPLPSESSESAVSAEAPAHVPVLPSSVISLLSPALSSSGPTLFLDGTIGAGGHAALLLSHPSLPPISHYVGIDRDTHALSLARARLAPLATARGTHLTLLRGDFRDAPGLLQRAGVETDALGGVSAALLDVGVSSMQLDTAARGFSFMRDGPLDMRMDGEGGDFARTAAEIVNSAEKEELVRIFREYGEEPRARLMADRVVRGRPFERTVELADAIAGGRRKSARGVHPATLCFQALRIVVNGELDALENGLDAVVQMLKPSTGRLGVISFHSGEDRIVKKGFRKWNEVPGGVEILTKKPVVAAKEECVENPRSRSAKLRVCRRLAVGEMPRRGKVNKYRPDRPALEVS